MVFGGVPRNIMKVMQLIVICIVFIVNFLKETITKVLDFQSVVLKINSVTLMKNKIYQVLILLLLPLLTLSQEAAKLLTSTKFNNGDLIPEAKTASEWEQLSMSNQPVFMKKVLDGTAYYFYNWYAVSDIRGIVNEKWMIPKQKEIVIWNSYAPIEIVPIGIVSEQGAFTKVSNQQYYWTTSEYNEKEKRESAVSFSISVLNNTVIELKQAYKQEGFLVCIFNSEFVKDSYTNLIDYKLNLNGELNSNLIKNESKIENQTSKNKYTNQNSIQIEKLKIGQFYEGGYIFYLDNSGEHGLVCLSYKFSKFNWFDAHNLFKKSNEFGFKDWRLPNSFELDLIYNQRVSLGIFEKSYFWTNESEGLKIAKVVDFRNGKLTMDYKKNVNFFLAVRSF
jgi:hypothetical protein